MSIEQTHILLMTKGPEATEFNPDNDDTNVNRFGNYFTYMEF